MTVLESPSLTDNAETVAAQALNVAREELGQVVRNPRPVTEAIDERMVDYLNAFQYVHFLNGHPKHFTGGNVDRNGITAIAIGIKNEVELILGNSVETTYEIEPRIMAYISDDVGLSLREQDLYALPRAVSLTLIDLIDTYRIAI